MTSILYVLFNEMHVLAVSCESVFTMTGKETSLTYFENTYRYGTCNIKILKTIFSLQQHCKKWYVFKTLHEDSCLSVMNPLSMKFCNM